MNVIENTFNSIAFISENNPVNSCGRLKIQKR